MNLTRSKAVPTIQVENDRIRVTEYNFVSGAETEFHTHAWDYIVVPQSDGELLLIDENGVEKTSKLQKGKSYYRKAGVTHNVINNGKDKLVFVEIEIKAYPI